MNNSLSAVLGFASACGVFFWLADFNGDRLIKYAAGGLLLLAGALVVSLLLNKKGSQ